MHPSQFVAIFGSSPETGWPALTGRDDNSIRRESRNNGRKWFWNLLFLRNPATNIKRTLGRKEVFNEKARGNTWSSSGSGNCRARHS
jgi:hypothetical protein